MPQPPPTDLRPPPNPAPEGMIQVYYQTLLQPQPLLWDPSHIAPETPGILTLYRAPPLLSSSNQVTSSRIDPPTWLSSMPNPVPWRDAQDPALSTSCSHSPEPQPLNSTHGSAGRAAGYC